MSSTGLPKVYLAGKISPNDWRHQAVPSLRGAWGSEGSDPFADSWPTLEGAVLNGRADYIGPYFVSCDHSCAHGPRTHATSDGGCLQGAGNTNLSLRQLTFISCQWAILQCDLVVAWIDAPDCYGTLAEIGYAVARGKRVVIGFDRNTLTDDQIDDFWFTQIMTGSEESAALKHHGPLDLLAAAIPVPSPVVQLDSEAERRFWNAYQETKPPSTARPGHPAQGAPLPTRLRRAIAEVRNRDRRLRLPLRQGDLHQGPEAPAGT